MVRKNYKRKPRTYRKKKGMVRRALAPSRCPYVDMYAPRVMVKHRYDDQFVTNIVNGGPNLTYFYRLNSVYDPDYQAASLGRNAQPSGYDFMALQYGFYDVKKVKIEYSIAVYPDYTPPGATTPVGLKVRLAAFANAAGFLSPLMPPEAGETKFSRSMICTSEKPIKGTWTVSPKQLSGLYGTAANSYAGAVVGTNPGNPHFFALDCTTLDLAGSISTLKTLVSLKFTFLTEWQGNKVYAYRDV